MSHLCAGVARLPARTVDDINLVVGDVEAVPQAPRRVRRTISVARILALARLVLAVDALPAGGATGVVDVVPIAIAEQRSFSSNVARDACAGLQSESPSSSPHDITNVLAQDRCRVHPVASCRIRPCRRRPPGRRTRPHSCHRSGTGRRSSGLLIVSLRWDRFGVLLGIDLFVGL